MKQKDVVDITDFDFTQVISVMCTWIMEEINKPLRSLYVMESIAKEVSNGSIDIIFHMGGISYFNGFLIEWDYFLHLLSPIASKATYMTAIGNHVFYITYKKGVTIWVGLGR
ncbi:probable inactive purple acid phosphatase 27 [Rutidosis leptorrhynchoides]|uniref:probable inactive purple acid phosphatase 27 n=1 Tax=Rutidosis leptorrhynchoides TaxID=125765 RepID=UPI003A99FBCC